jgi:hypothetical protein
MITLNGTLLVKTVHGRRGDFAVGTLLTEIGEFKVKDTILDQFSEGEYRGHFAVSRIYQGSYAWKGATISELRANITDIELEEATEKSVEAAESPSAADPIEEPRVAAQVPAAPQSSPEPANEISTDSAPAVFSNATADDIESAIALGAPVKLDPTVDRSLFRTQRDRLKAVGYCFDASTQTWLPANANE